MTDSECKRLLVTLTAAWPKAEMPEPTAKLYMRCLRDLPYDVADATVAHAVTTRTWMPTISELRAIAAQLCQQANGRPPADAAWAEFKAAVHRYGYANPPEWSHPAVKAAANALGYRDFCLSDSEQEPSWRARFLQVYAAQSDREVAQVQMLPEVHTKLAALAASMGAWRKQIEAPAAALPAPTAEQA
jgi:hypothetical protein